MSGATTNPAASGVLGLGVLGEFTLGVGLTPSPSTGAVPSLPGMRTWGRPTNRDGSRGPWTMVTTDANGQNDMVYLTTLCQCLLLNLGESPFHADYGIPAHESVISQIFPDYYITLTQMRFAPYFASLIVSRLNAPDPTYQINVTTHAGVKLNAAVPIPT